MMPILGAQVFFHSKVREFPRSLCFNPERKTGLEPATYSLGSCRSTR